MSTPTKSATGVQGAATFGASMGLRGDSLEAIGEEDMNGAEAFEADGYRAILRQVVENGSKMCRHEDLSRQTWGRAMAGKIGSSDERFDAEDCS